LAAANQMPHQVAPQRIAAEHDDVYRQHDGTDADAERHCTRRRIGEPERLPDVRCEDEKKDDGEIHEISVNILKDQREPSLPSITLPRLTHRASRRVGPECFVIASAIVVASDAKASRRPQYKQSRREW